VGGKNDNNLSYKLIDNFIPPFPKHDLQNNVNSLKIQNTKILFAKEAFTPISFYDLGALVYFIKIISGKLFS
jgi:hypothetical protein